ncbi:MAG: hypothetical protein R2815_12385 [Flavobacteriales bacterium]
MKTYQLLLILGLVITTSACTKDEITPAGDNCSITCQNGGILTQDCSCDCPPGFNGPTCENSTTQQEPTGFQISAIRLISWMPSNGGQPWDATSNIPGSIDPYLIIKLNNALVGQTFTYSSVVQGDDLLYYNEYGITFFPIHMDLNDQLTIYLRDMDFFDPDDAIGGLLHTLSLDNYDGSGRIMVENASIQLEMELLGTWTY